MNHEQTTSSYDVARTLLLAASAAVAVLALRAVQCVSTPEVFLLLFFAALFAAADLNHRGLCMVLWSATVSLFWGAATGGAFALIGALLSPACGSVTGMLIGFGLPVIRSLIVWYNIYCDVEAP